MKLLNPVRIIASKVLEQTLEFFEYPIEDINQLTNLSHAIVIRKDTTDFKKLIDGHFWEYSGLYISASMVFNAESTIVAAKKVQIALKNFHN